MVVTHNSTSGQVRSKHTLGCTPHNVNIDDIMDECTRSVTVIVLGDIQDKCTSAEVNRLNATYPTAPQCHLQTEKMITTTTWIFVIQSGR
eukprot:1711044-Amphidinium_carterae.2